MKTRAKKQADLEALAENFKSSKSAILLSFNGLTVEKDQEFRKELRETGAKYGVVKNTLARVAVKGTTFEDTTEHFKGVTSVAWTDGEPVELSKVVSKFLKESKDIFSFKAGVVEGRVVTIDEVNSIAALPSKEGLIGKLLFLLNAPAQGLHNVLSALPRDLAVVVKQVSEREGDVPEAKADEAKKEDVKAEEPKKEEAPAAADVETKDDAPAAEAAEAADSGDSAEEAPAQEAEAAPADNKDSDSKEDGDEPADKKDSE